MSKREYKSNVFSMLLEEADKALSVYNALNNSDYDNEDMVEMTRLDNGIILTIRNDASFVIDNDLSLYEQQSSYSPNMPLRCLIYFAEIIKKATENEDLYGRKKVMLPTPQFVVFYNGKEERPGVEILKISDSFIKEPKENSMELVCIVYNINMGKNDELLDKCSVLREYMLFTNKVNDKVNAYTERGIERKQALESAIDEAIAECIEEDVLKEFLLRRGNEVREMAALDYTWERREALIARDNKETGRLEGRIISLYYDAHFSIEEIAQKVGCDVQYVKDVVENAESM